MATVTGLATTFDLPNFVGELFSVTPTDTPFVTAIGNLTGGEVTTSANFEWQSYDLRAVDQRVNLEGQDAPTLETRSRSSIDNICQIVHEAYGVTYTKQAATGQFDGLNIAGSNPVGDEFGWQGVQMIKQIKRDLEYAFVNGEYNKPTDNTTKRSTKGIIAATTTNRTNLGTDLTNGGAFTVTEADPGVFTTTGGAHGLVVGDQVNFTIGSGELPTIVRTSGVTSRIREGETFYIAVVPLTTTFEITDVKGSTTGLEVTDAGTTHATRLATEAAALTEATVLDLMQDVWDNGGIMEEETRVLMCNSWQKRRLTDQFITTNGYEEASRTVGGVAVQRIQTDFGGLNVMLNRHMPNGAIQVVSLEEIAPVFLMIPGKGFLFSEILSKTGAEIRAQIYGEVGLKWGNERKHGLLTGLTAS